MKPPDTDLGGNGAHDATDRRSVLDWPGRVGATEEVLAELAGISRRRRRRWAGGIAASGLIAFTLLLWPGRESEEQGVAPGIKIVIDSPAQQTLSDGTLVDLQEGAAVREIFNDQLRQVVLEHGTAHFQVVKDPTRPFVVQADGLKVRAVGTAFSVVWASSGIEVLVTEGRVVVVPSATGIGKQPEAIAGAGERVTMVAPATLATGPTFAVATLTATELAERMAWRLPRLHFADAPLAEAVALLNRHNRRKLVIEDNSLRSLQISGVLRADNQAAFLEALQANFGIEAVPQGTDEIRLRRRTAAIIN